MEPDQIDKMTEQELRSDLRKCVKELVEQRIELATIRAIGRWVPVEERLPENGVRCVVRGHDNKLFCADHFCNGIWDKWEHEPTVTHWLELDLPSGKEEA